MHVIAAMTAPGVAFAMGVVCTWLSARPARAELARARWDAEHDPLTRLPNRAALRRRFNQDRAAGRSNAVVLLDLNGFKKVNDTWGHRAGDALLVAIACRLAEACESVAVVGRLGGDEFVMLLRQENVGDVVDAVRPLLDRISGPVRVAVGRGATTRLSVTASVGIAMPGRDTSWSEQLGQADIAMYQAKNRQAGLVVFDGPESTGRHSTVRAVNPDGRKADPRRTAGAARLSR